VVSGHAVTRRWVGLALGVFAWIAFLLLSANPAVAEVVAGTGPIPALRRILSLASGVVGVSLAEFVVLAVVVRQAVGGWKGVKAVREELIGVRRALGYGALRLAQDAGVLLFLFYLLWGFQYARPGLEERLGIAAAGEVSADELHHLALRSVERLNALYREVHGSGDAGAATAAPDLATLVPGLHSGWARVVADFGLAPQMNRRHGDPKTFLSTPLMKRFGVAGMHFPYTGEALVLSDLPGVLLGMDMGHEMAHQRGIAREADANVLAFLVAASSDDPLARYSAQHFLNRQLVTALQRIAPTEARDVTRMREPGVARDYAHVREFWQPAQGVAGAAATRVNNAMLRSHGIPEGVASYQGSVWVLVAVAREWGEDKLFR